MEILIPDFIKQIYALPAYEVFLNFSNETSIFFEENPSEFPGRLHFPIHALDLVTATDLGCCTIYSSRSTGDSGYASIHPACKISYQDLEWVKTAQLT